MVVVDVAVYQAMWRWVRRVSLYTPGERETAGQTGSKCPSQLPAPVLLGGRETRESWTQLRTGHH